MTNFRTITTLLLLCISTQFTFGQTFDQLGSAFAGIMLTSDPVEVFYDSQNAPLVAKMQNGDLRVEYFDGSWTALDPSVPVLASGVEDFELDYSNATNTIIIIYVDGDSLYLREYDNVWQDEVTVGAYTSSVDDQCDLVINPIDQVAYIAYNSGGWSTWTEYDYINDTFTLMPTDPMITIGIYFDESDIAYNQKDSLMYLVYENYALNEGVATFDGTSWNNIMTSVDGMDFSTTTLNITAAFDTTGTNSLLVHTATIPNKEVGIAEYTMPGQVSSFLEPWYAPQSVGPLYGTDMTTRHANGNPTYAYSCYPGADMEMFIKYWDGSSWNAVNNSFLNYRIMDIAYDLNDNLLIAAIFEDDIKLYIYRVNIHTADVTEISPLELNIFPNPATESITVHTSVPCSATIISIDGTTVISSEDMTQDHQIDVQQLNSGLYFVRTVAKDGTISSSKFTKH